MFADLAILIPLLPTLGWFLITLFGKAMPGRSAAWLATSLMAVSTVLAIGLFLEVSNAAPRWSAEGLEKVYKLEKEEKASAVGMGEFKPAEGTTLDGLKLEGKLITTEKEHPASIKEALEKSLEAEATGEFPIVRQWPWLTIQGQEGLPFGFYFDQLAAIMILMVTFVCTLIHLFSIGYMWGEDRYPTFFAYINLFAAAMLAMVMAKNLFHVLLFWEIMGLMSYLLIGFFYKKRSAQQAMKKAFLTVRVGDLAFMAGLFWLYQKTGTLDIPKLIEQGASGELAVLLAGGAATGIGLLLFLAAVGKSAQFPLHVWLPDAMEGPTPVSAMIHAATMVAAGVYLVARAYPIMIVGDVLPIIAWIGGITAIFAASMAPAFADAKKIMAFSTLSQLGYMFLSLGLFGYTAAMFHLLTHAFFKALLFLGSGSMIHGSGTQDVFEMDRLAKYQKWTLGTVWIGALSLMGFPLFAGFWSKDEILHVAQGANAVLYAIGVLTAVLTAFYTTRLMIIAFYKPKTASPWNAAWWNQEGEASLNMTRAEVEADAALSSHAASSHGAHGTPHDQAETEHDQSHAHHPHESGPEMIVPLVLLATGAFVMGFVGSPASSMWFQRFVYFGEPEVIPLSSAIGGYLISLAIVLVGAGVAYFLYGGARDHTRQIAPDWLTMLLQRRYFIDDFYYKVVNAAAQAPTAIIDWLDRNIVDRLVDFVGIATASVGDLARRVQTGAVGLYAWLIVIGAAVIALAFAYAGGQR